ncbi:MAG: MerR family transcriptional regulator [Gammaproteobacteria bacterium]|nr:MerR family transcriptional regulator [Gammaproteobacteria bacterium]
MYIGEVSNQTGASVKAIRFYEELGLLTGVGRSGRYRVYTDTHVLLIRLIVKAKEQGFKLAELKAVVTGNDVREPWFHVLEMIEQKQQALSEEILLKQNQQKALSEYRAQIQSCLSDNPQCQLEDGI